MSTKLIYDIGMHIGRDTKFYLEKGFSVVAVEAVPRLANEGRAKFAAAIAAKRLVIVEKAISGESGKEISFYINPEKDDWGSAFKGAAEKGMGNSIQITVPTTTLGDIVKEHGLPYYLKCDIENSDKFVVEQLLDLAEKPKFVSVEVSEPDDFDGIFKLGYDRAQLVNQWLHPETRAPSPAREGVFVGERFDGHSSGLFGRELDPGKWIPVREAYYRFARWCELRKLDPALTIGWWDIHLATSETLNSNA